MLVKHHERDAIPTHQVKIIYGKWLTYIHKTQRH